MENKIEFIIKTDSNGNNVSLENMPIEAATALKVFLESLTEIARLQVNSSEVTLSVKPGSICAELKAPHTQFQDIFKGLDDVINHRSKNKEYVRAYREIQKTIKANGLGYDVKIFNGSSENSILSSFKTHKEFRVSRGPKKETRVSLEFIKGKLLEIGGKNPNFHVDLPEGILKVNCTEREAQKINTFLYNTVYFSAWKYHKRNQKPIYYVCDHYIHEDMYNDLKLFHETNIETTGTERFHQIHDKLVSTIANNQLGAVRKILRLFKNESVEHGKIRTILITLKAFKEKEEISEMMEDLASILRTQLGQNQL